jgi:hypothetical protein
MTSNIQAQQQQTLAKEDESILRAVKYKVGSSLTQNAFQQSNETSVNALDALLENEKQHNKSDTWNKLNKTMRIQKLHQYAETYGQANKLPVKEIKSLKMFFNDCLDKSKLQRTKDIVYDKEKGIITQIPALHLNATTRSFTLKNMDSKRVSTIKSLTPKKITPKDHHMTIKDDTTTKDD